MDKLYRTLRANTIHYQDQSNNFDLSDAMILI